MKPPTDADPLARFKDLKDRITYYNWLGCRREQLLNDIRTEQLLAEAAGDEERAHVCRDLLLFLPTTTYTLRSNGSWKITVPELGEESSLPTRSDRRVA